MSACDHYGWFVDRWQRSKPCYIVFSELNSHRRSKKCYSENSRENCTWKISLLAAKTRYNFILPQLFTILDLSFADRKGKLKRKGLNILACRRGLFPHRWRLFITNSSYFSSVNAKESVFPNTENFIKQ